MVFPGAEALPTPCVMAKLHVLLFSFRLKVETFLFSCMHFGVRMRIIKRCHKIDTREHLSCVRNNSVHRRQGHM